MASMANYAALLLFLFSNDALAISIASETQNLDKTDGQLREPRIRRVAPPPSANTNQIGGTDQINFPSAQNVSGGNVNFYVAPPTAGVPPPLPPGQSEDSEILRITVKAGSQLFIPPGSSGNIYLTVKDAGSLYSVFTFSTSLSFINVQPYQAALGAGEQIEVRLSATIPYSTYQGSTIPITFFARRTDNAYASRKILLQTRQEPQDTTPPNCRVLVAEKCGSYTSSNCADKSWIGAVEIADIEAGLRSIETTPELQFNGEDFTVGTNGTTIMSFKTSCCQSRVEVVATDIRGNKKSLLIDGNAPDTAVQLGSGDVAAITLGVILILLIVLIAVNLIIRSRKRRAFKAVLKVSRAKHEDSQLMER